MYIYFNLLLGFNNAQPHWCAVQQIVIMFDVLIIIFNIGILNCFTANTMSSSRVRNIKLTHRVGAVGTDNLYTYTYTHTKLEYQPKYCRFAVLGFGHCRSGNS
jgi:hypothetical protein